MPHDRIIIRDAQSGDIMAQGTLGVTVVELEGCYYFKPADVDQTRLVTTARTYTCPYKGTCLWVDLSTEGQRRLENVAFIYHRVNDGYAHIRDLIGFYGRSMRGISVEKDGDGQPGPQRPPTGALENKL